MMWDLLEPRVLLSGSDIAPTLFVEPPVFPADSATANESGEEISIDQGSWFFDESTGEWIEVGDGGDVYVDASADNNDPAGGAGEVWMDEGDGSIQTWVYTNDESQVDFNSNWVIDFTGEEGGSFVICTRMSKSDAAGADENMYDSASWYTDEDPYATDGTAYDATTQETGTEESADTGAAADEQQTPETENQEQPAANDDGTAKDDSASVFADEGVIDSLLQGQSDPLHRQTDGVLA